MRGARREAVGELRMDSIRRFAVVWRTDHCLLRRAVHSGLSPTERGDASRRGVGQGD